MKWIKLQTESKIYITEDPIQYYALMNYGLLFYSRDFLRIGKFALIN